MASERRMSTARLLRLNCMESPTPVELACLPRLGGAVIPSVGRPARRPDRLRAKLLGGSLGV